MLSRFFILFVLLICFHSISKAQNVTDSLFYDQKFKRLQFQLDSLNRTLRFKNDVFEGLKQQETIDTLRSRLKKMELENRVVRHNLYKVYEQNKAANIFVVVGYGLSLISPLMINGQYELGIISGVSGVALVVTSFILRFDSNKFLKGAGKKYKVVRVTKQL